MSRRARTRPTIPSTSRGFDEARFHRWLERALRRTGSSGLRMGDDVAAVRFRGTHLLLTTDALSEGTHFLSETPPERIGRAAVAASLSDLASKGGTPLAVLLDLLIPRATPERWCRSVVRGAEAFASQHGCHVLGGDTKQASERAVVGTIVGWAPAGALPARSGARPGDVLLTTGRVGAGGVAAFPILQGRRLRRIDLRRLVAIEPRLGEGRCLAPLVHAMVDTSDGLADGARSLAHASGVRIVVEFARLPFHPGLRTIRGAPRRSSLAFYGGDYELLAAIPPARAAEAIRRVRCIGGQATLIGVVERGRGAYVSDGGRRRPMPRAGWDPFRTS
ncbi:MAG: thiamine-phosphate kinase [Thermoplasmata archaeon]|nr:thiamine-phosphate kinase [Thermoplasmata archaeon]